MSEVLKGDDKHSESLVSQSETSMGFWGICCESGNLYKQLVGKRFRVTMAVLDPESFHKDENKKIVSLMVIRGKFRYLLCVLKHGELHQVNLNLIFDKGEQVQFYINGYGKVYLSGYQLTDSGDLDENGYLCPIVEVQSKEKKKKVSKNPVKTESETVMSKSKKKIKAEKKAMEEDSDPSEAVYKAFLEQSEIDEGEFDDDDADESDLDFSVIDEDSESDEEEDDTSDEDFYAVEIDEGNVKVDQNCQGSRKRKHEKMLQPQKRLKNDSLNVSSSVQNSDDVICIDNESDYDDAMNSSIGNTPMPKKQINNEAASSEKKKLKKKNKRLSEVSNISEKSVNIKNDEQELKSPTAKSTPNKQKGENKSKHPVQRLEGGVEIQDVIVGRGPVAIKGKTVHVFYVGRFEDKTIFDSRVPGKKPFSFKLGVQQVIKGWDVGLQGMRVGGQRKLKVPPNMGYGNSRNVGIPPNSTLYFTVELQAVS